MYVYIYIYMCVCVCCRCVQQKMHNICRDNIYCKKFDCKRRTKDDLTYHYILTFPYGFKQADTIIKNITTVSAVDIPLPEDVNCKIGLTGVYHPLWAALEYTNLTNIPTKSINNNNENIEVKFYFKDQWYKQQKKGKKKKQIKSLSLVQRFNVNKDWKRRSKINGQTYGEIQWDMALEHTHVSDATFNTIIKQYGLCYEYKDIIKESIINKTYPNNNEIEEECIQDISTKLFSLHYRKSGFMMGSLVNERFQAKEQDPWNIQLFKPNGKNDLLDLIIGSRMYKDYIIDPTTGAFFYYYKSDIHSQPDKRYYVIIVSHENNRNIPKKNNGEIDDEEGGVDEDDAEEEVDRRL
eukprot:GHVR01085501.1.p1 GENE.GHVR01085501.1~~GHVR01085501.1.p1  ORF type:complete len:351 (-),score=68.38 GHVR01085501.1:172-1224(-)